MTTITKGQIGEQDIARFDGTGTNTFSRETSTGATLTLTKFGCEVDAAVTYGAGVSYTGATIQSALTAIGTTTKTTLLLRPGTWTVSANTDWSAYANVTFKFTPGAIISHGAYTLKLPIPEAGNYQIFDGTGAITFNEGRGDILVPWFPNTAAGIALALKSAPNGSSVKFTKGFTYIASGADTITISNTINIICDIDVEIDATTNTAFSVIDILGTDSTSYTLVTPVAKHAITITVPEELGLTLSENDVLRISSQSASGDQWVEGGSSFWKGEFAIVESVAAPVAGFSTIRLKHELWDDYANATLIYKTSTVRGSLQNFRLKGNPDTKNVGVRVYRSRDYVVRGGEIHGFGSANLIIFYSLDTLIDNFTASHSYEAAGGNNYGLAIDSTQNINVVNSHIYGARHAITTGGYAPSRNVNIIGNTLMADKRLTGYVALDNHVNIEGFCASNNIIHGGIEVSGRDISVLHNTINGAGYEGGIKIQDTSVSNKYNISHNIINMYSDDTMAGIKVELESGYPIKDIVIDNNYIYQDGNHNGIYIGLDNSEILDSLTIANNTIYSTDSSPILVNGTTSADTIGRLIIENNKFNVDKVSIQHFWSQTVSLPYIKINNNQFNNNVAGAGGNIIQLTATTVLDTVLIKNNSNYAGGSSTASYRIDADVNMVEFTGNNGHKLSRTLSLGNCNYLLYANNICNACSSTDVFTNVLKKVYGTFGNISSNSMTTGTAAPTTGTWAIGDICYDSTPVSGQAMGWTCSSSGTFEDASENGCATTSGSNIITSVTSTSGFSVGQYIDASAGFAALTALKILTIVTDTSITVDRAANATGAVNITTTNPTWIPLPSLP